ncbi:unnamed protein product [Cercospora beticola]|nr:unnamed protein product [Cercospora beticola]
MSSSLSTPASDDPVAIPKQKEPATPSSASQRTLGVVELLESILMHLDPVHIIAAEEVCQHWRSVIAGSLLLKKCACLIADDSLANRALEVYCVRCQCRKDFVTLDPNYRGLYPPHPRYGLSSFRQPLKLSELAGNRNKSLLQTVPTHCRVYRHSELENVTGLYDVWMELNLELTKACLDMDTHSKASYLDMLICQPLPTRAELRIYVRYSAGNGLLWHCSVRNADGIRLRDVVYALREKLQIINTTEAGYIYGIDIKIRGGGPNGEHDIFFPYEHSQEVLRARLLAAEQAQKNEESSKGGVCKASSAICCRYRLI